MLGHKAQFPSFAIPKTYFYFIFWMELFYVDTIIFQHYFIILEIYPSPEKKFF